MIHEATQAWNDALDAAAAIVKARHGGDRIVREILATKRVEEKPAPNPYAAGIRRV